jgi:hypothetical protein
MTITTTFVTVLRRFKYLAEKVMYSNHYSIDNIRICNGPGAGKSASHFCTGENERKNTNRCSACAYLRKHVAKKAANLAKNKMQLKVKRKLANKHCVYLKRKHQSQGKQIIQLQKKMANMRNMNDLIAKLPENQQQVVRMCFESVGRPLKGRRYSKDWIYTCILMKIKSPKLYRHF